MNAADRQPLLTTRQVAELLAVSPATVLRLVGISTTERRAFTVFKAPRTPSWPTWRPLFFR